MIAVFIASKALIACREKIAVMSSVIVPDPTTLKNGSGVEYVI